MPELAGRDDQGVPGVRLDALRDPGDLPVEPGRAPAEDGARPRMLFGHLAGRDPARTLSLPGKSVADGHPSTECDKDGRGCRVGVTWFC